MIDPAAQVVLAAAVIAAVPPTLATIVAWFSSRKAQRVQLQATIDVHNVVNSRLTAALDRVGALETEVRRLNDPAERRATSEAHAVTLEKDGTVSVRPTAHPDALPLPQWPSP